MPYDVLVMLTRPSVLLRIEEAALLVLAVFLYQHQHCSWFLFTILFFAPDLFMLGYLISPSLGSATYNLVHTLWLPIALLFVERAQLLHLSIKTHQREPTTHASPRQTIDSGSVRIQQYLQSRRARRIAYKPLRSNVSSGTDSDAGRARYSG